MDDDITFNIIKEHFKNKKIFGIIYKKLMYSFREYMLVDGMPQAINEYYKKKDFGAVDIVKQGILNLYETDIDAQEEENPNYVKNMFWQIPSKLSKQI